MIKVDDKEIKKLERDLKTFGDRAFPFATKNTINTAAFKTREVAQKDISVKMIERNRFTKQSVRVVQSRTLHVSRQAATVGSIADYMADQEFGGVKRKQGKEGVAIPTGFSAGQYKQEPRTRLPRKPNRIGNIRLQQRGRRAKNRKQAIVFRIQDAVRTGKRYIFLDLGRKKGIFRVVGGSRNIKRGVPKGAKLRMVQDLTEQAVVIPRNPWLKPAVDNVAVMMPGMYRNALRFQLKRLNILS
ncbi:MAG: hypothetical protein K0U20_08665 [Proteobacteria bacterium]|nr:hypothetical protein [Pseudomonadota bacterium]